MGIGRLAAAGNFWYAETYFEGPLIGATMREKEKLSGPWPQRKVNHHRKQKEGMALILKDAQIGRTYVVEALHLLLSWSGAWRRWA